MDWKWQGRERNGDEGSGRGRRGKRYGKQGILRTKQKKEKARERGEKRKIRSTCSVVGTMVKLIEGEQR